MDVELRHLRAVVAIADTGSISAASRALGMAQPNLSALLRRIERRLDRVLFSRVPSGVVLTAAGREVVDSARMALDAVDRIVDPPGPGPERRQVRAVSAGLTLEAVLTDLTEPMRAARWSVWATSPEEGVGLVRRGDAEVFVGLHWPHQPWPPLRGLTTREILREPVAVLLPAGHRCAAEPVVRLADLAGERWISRTDTPGVLEGECRAAGFAPDIAFRAAENESFRRLVGHGLAVSLASPVFRGDADTVVRPYAEAGLIRWLLVHRPDRFPPEWADHVVTSIRARHRIRLAQVGWTAPLSDPTPPDPPDPADPTAP